MGGGVTCTGRPGRCWGSRPSWSPWGSSGAHPDAAGPKAARERRPKGRGEKVTHRTGRGGKGGPAPWGGLRNQSAEPSFEDGRQPALTTNRQERRREHAANPRSASSDGRVRQPVGQRRGGLLCGPREMKQATKSGGGGEASAAGCSG